MNGTGKNTQTSFQYVKTKLAKTSYDINTVFCQIISGWWLKNNLEEYESQ
jgi:hypothetical protein